MDIETAVTQFLDDQEEGTRKLSSGVLQRYRAWFVQTTGHELALDNWLASDVRDWLTYLYKVKQCSPKTYNTYLQRLKAFCAWCEDENIMARNPLSKLKGIKSQRQHSPSVLSRNEENQLLRVLAEEDPLDRFVMLFMAHTGLRRSELVSIALSHITLGERCVTLDTLIDSQIPNAESFRTGTLTIRKGKGNKWREVPLNGSARAVLLDYLRVRPRIESNQLVVSLKRRAPMTTWGVGEICDKFRERTGIAHLTPHLLRRTLGTKLAQGSGIEAAADILGHADIRTTRNNYVATDPNRLRAAIEKLSEE